MRKSRKWSMQETADRLEIAKSTYAGYEYGYREPSLQALSDIADLFETSVDHILGRSEQSLELTKSIDEESISLTLDGVSLSNEELIDFIAFTRIKRELSKKETFIKKEA
nr:helix-turn-helix transcriptional regulator [Robertmurraya korlensis]